MTSLNANSSLRMSRTANLPTGDFTLTFWGKRPTSGDGSPHAFATLTSSNNAWEMYHLEGDARLWINAASSDNTLASSTTNVWYFFALVRSGSTVTLYHRTDAASSLSSTSAGTSNGSLTSIHYFSWNDGSTDGGTVEQIRAGRLWNTALTSTQILAESRKSTPVVTSGLVQAYTFLNSTSPGTDTSGNGYNLTTSGTGGNSGDQPTFPDDTADQSITASGIASAEAFGTPTVALASQSISPSSIGSAEAFGGATLTTLTSIAPSSIASLEAFGTAVVSTGNVNVSPTGISSLEGFGTCVVSAGATTVSPSGIASANAFGSCTVTTGAVTISPTGIVSTGAFGTPIVHGDRQTTSINSNGLAGFQMLATDGDFSSGDWMTHCWFKVKSGSLAEPRPTWQFIFGTNQDSNGVSTPGGRIMNTEIYVDGPTGDIYAGGFDQVDPDQMYQMVTGADVQKWIFVVLEGDGPSLVRVRWRIKGQNTWGELTYGAQTYDNSGYLAQGFVAPSHEPFLDGLLAQAIVWDGHLTDTELDQQFFSDVPITPSIATVNRWYPMDDASAMGIDSGPNGYDGNPTNPTGGTTVLDSPFEDTSYITGAGGIASGEAFGTPTVSTIQSVAPSSIGSGEAFGTHAVAPGGVTVAPSSIASTEAHGTATVTPGAVTVSPSSIGSAEAHGTPTVSPGAVSVAPTGISSGEAFGSATVLQGLFVAPSGIASLETFGSATVSPGSVSVSPPSIASSEAFGTSVVTTSTIVAPTGIGSVETFGTATVTPGGVVIAPLSIESLEALGTPFVGNDLQIVNPSGISSLEGFGNPVVSAGATFIAPSSIASSEEFGTATFASISSLAPSNIDSAEAFGNPVLTTGPVAIYPSGIESGEAFGTARLFDSSYFPAPKARTASFGVRSRSRRSTFGGSR